MERMSVTQAVRQLSDLMNRVFYQGATVELERGNRIIAQIPEEQRIRCSAFVELILAQIPALSFETEAARMTLVPHACCPVS
jgi:hypothetical protein